MSCRFLYLDTNIWSHLAKDSQYWAPLGRYLAREGMVLGVSGAQLVELSDAQGLHSALCALFDSLPCALTKPWDQIMSEEFRAYPAPRRDSLLLCDLRAAMSQSSAGVLGQLLLSPDKWRAVRQQQRRNAEQMSSRLAQRKSTFPPSSTGYYTVKQAGLFADLQVIQWLAQIFGELPSCQHDGKMEFHPEVFSSIRLYALVVFYKYYLQQREARRQSDFGDLFHLFPVPYCELVVLERDLCEILRQIGRRCDVLRSTRVCNIDWLEGLVSS